MSKELNNYHLKYRTSYRTSKFAVTFIGKTAQKAYTQNMLKVPRDSRL